MDNEKIPQIRDMTNRCKCCGGYFFEVNKDGLCTASANGNAPVGETNVEDDWDNF